MALAAYFKSLDGIAGELAPTLSPNARQHMEKALKEWHETPLSTEEQQSWARGLLNAPSITEIIEAQAGTIATRLQKTSDLSLMELKTELSRLTERTVLLEKRVAASEAQEGRMREVIREELRRELEDHRNQEHSAQEKREKLEKLSSSDPSGTGADIAVDLD